MDPQLATISGAIRQRRSLKPTAMDSGRAVPEDLLTTLLENATWAPTHGVTEPWRFSVYSGDARHALASTLQELYQTHTPPAGFRPDKFTKLGTNPTLAPVVITIGVRLGTSPKIPDLEEKLAVACAVQNFHLSAAAAGLGAFWSSPPITAHPDFVGFIGLAPTDTCLGLLYVGWPAAGAAWPVSKRSPVADRVTWNR